jgi:hypothetical protein
VFSPRSSSPASLTSIVWSSIGEKYLPKEMSHGRHAVRYQCPSRDDESNDYGESEGQCGPYQEPQGFGKVPERSGTFCLRPDPNGHSFSRSGGQTLGQFSEPERVQSEAITAREGPPDRILLCT